MKKINIISLLLLSFFILSCANRTQFVVLRSVPNNPSVTVVPVNENLREVEFAATVESYVLSAGVRVVHRPASKDALYAKKLAPTETPAEEIMTERYFPLEEAKSDYLIFTYASNRQIKLVKKATGEVLSSVIMAGALGTDQQSEAEIVVQNLRSAGLLSKKKK